MRAHLWSSVALVPVLAVLAASASRPAQSAPSSASAAQRACARLAALKVPNTVIRATHLDSAAEVNNALGTAPRPPGVASAAPVCRVELSITPAKGAEIRSEVWLPEPGRWNQRLLSVGVGGSAGVIDVAASAAGAAQGYATSVSDAGSHSRNIMDMRYGRDPELARNRATRGVHLTAVAAKALVRAYYGGPPRLAMFMGCSGGGYEALGSAQNHPEDYDGILAGDPALNWINAALWQGMSYRAALEDPAGRIPGDKLPALNRMVVAQCDALDGVRDNVIDDPRRCQIDFKAMQCTGADLPGCFTAPQVAMLKKLYAPYLHAVTGKLVYPGFPPGAEWTPAARHRLSGDGTRNSTITPDQPGPLMWTLPDSFKPEDWRTFDFVKTGDAAIASFAPYANSSPDIRQFHKRGGKLIMYSGWDEANLNPENLVNYYEDVRRTLGTKAADTSLRLFMAPGMGHCLGGPGPDIFGSKIADGLGRRTTPADNVLAALDRWASGGPAPERIVATKFAGEGVSRSVVRTRPLCAYPRVARWRGTGSTDDAANFACVAPPAGPYTNAR